MLRSLDLAVSRPSDGEAAIEVSRLEAELARRGFRPARTAAAVAGGREEEEVTPAVLPRESTYEVYTTTLG